MLAIVICNEMEPSLRVGIKGGFPLFFRNALLGKTVLLIQTDCVYGKKRSNYKCAFESMLANVICNEMEPSLRSKDWRWLSPFFFGHALPRNMFSRICFAA
jgi:hypothetical protein